MGEEIPESREAMMALCRACGSNGGAIAEAPFPFDTARLLDEAFCLYFNKISTSRLSV